MENLWVLAQADSNNIVSAENYDQNQQSTQTKQASEPNAAGTMNKKPIQGQWQPIILMVLIFVVLYFVMFKGPKKKQQQQEQMVKSLKKNDRVQTIGGILGTVLDVSDNEITLKVDESNNTKIKVLPSAISRVIEQK
ncbi:MAG: preprotein translocase subunit YajC [Sedimentisphaerales bacterium]